MPDSKNFTFLKPKNDLFGQLLDPTYFRAEGPILFFFCVSEKKLHHFFRAAEGGPKKKCTFFVFLAAEGGPKIFCPFLQYKRFLQGKKLVLSRKIILSRKTIFDPPPGGKGFSDLDTLGHYTCPCPPVHSEGET